MNLAYRSNIFLLLLTAFSLLAGCRSAEVEGVYGGMLVNTGLLTSTREGRELVLLLRPDGTFTDNMRERDWKSNVKGKYVVTGSTLKLVYDAQKKVEEYKINGKGNLSREGAIFLKMDKSNLVPEGVYDFRGTKSSGGPATGQLYVGDNLRASYYFDGVENFRDSGEGKTNGGTYQLLDGELTLAFRNRKTEQHSFFARKDAGTNKLAAVIDGRFYFSGDLSKDDPSNASEKKEAGPQEPGGATKPAVVDENSIAATNLPSINNVLDTLRASHGGSAIDAINTVYTEASSEGFDIFSYTDFSRSRVRFELYKNDTLVAVEQLEGRKGWRWMQGKITTLEPVRIDEIALSQHTGIMGLKKDLSEDFLNGTIEPAAHGYNLSFQVDGNQFIYVLDKDLNLLGDAYRIGDIEQASQYSNFKNVNGVSVPFTTEIFRDGQKSKLAVDKFIINRSLKTKWTKPAVDED